MQSLSSGQGKTIMEKPEKQRRRRGVVLTPTGLEKLLTAKQEAEYRDNRGHRFTLEVLSEKTLLGVDTLMKVFACESGVDKQTLKHCFQAFNLTLENSDYYRPNLPETNSINPQLLPELPEGQVPLNSPFYIHRNNLERANQLSLLPDKDLADFCPLIEPYQVTKNPVVLGVESVEMARYLTTVRIVLFILIYVS